MILWFLHDPCFGFPFPRQFPASCLCRRSNSPRSSAATVRRLRRRRNRSRLVASVTAQSANCGRPHRKDSSLPWRGHLCLRRRDSLENPHCVIRKLLRSRGAGILAGHVGIRADVFHPPLRVAAHAHSSRRSFRAGPSPLSEAIYNRLLLTLAPGIETSGHASQRATEDENGWVP